VTWISEYETSETPDRTAEDELEIANNADTAAADGVEREESEIVLLSVDELHFTCFFLRDPRLALDLGSVSASTGPSSSAAEA